VIPTNSKLSTKHSPTALFHQIESNPTQMKKNVSTFHVKQRFQENAKKLFIYYVTISD
jgi:hypothetical protein